MTRRCALGSLRALAVATLVGVVALQTPGHVGAAPAATVTITVKAVDGSGEAVNGYQVANRRSALLHGSIRHSTDAGEGQHTEAAACAGSHE